MLFAAASSAKCSCSDCCRTPLRGLRFPPANPVTSTPTSTSRRWRTSHSVHPDAGASSKRPNEAAATDVPTLSRGPSSRRTP